MLLSTSRLTGLSADLLAEEQNTFALIRLGLTERTNLSTYLTEKLLVAGLQDNLGVLVSLGLCLNLNLRGKLKKDGMCVAERELQEVALIGDTVADTYQLKLLLVTLGNTNDHVVDERAIEAVESLLLLRLNCVVFFNDFESYFAISNVDLDGRINNLRHFTLRAFYSNLVVITDIDSHSGRNAYGQFTYS